LSFEARRKEESVTGTTCEEEERSPAPQASSIPIGNPLEDWMCYSNVDAVDFLRRMSTGLTATRPSRPRRIGGIFNGASIESPVSSSLEP